MATVTFSAADDVLYAYLAGEIDHDAAQGLRIQLDALQRLSGNPCGAGQMREQERRADALLLPRGCAALDFTRR